MSASIFVSIIVIINISYSSSQVYEEILASNYVCFNAKYYNSSTIFNAPRNGTIIGIRLDHISGSVTCHDYNNYPSTKWGCSASETTETAVFNTVFLRYTPNTDYYGTLYYPTQKTKGIYINYGDPDPNDAYYYGDCARGCTFANYNVSGYNPLNSPNFTLFEPQYNVTTNEQFMLQYTEACCPDVMRSHDNKSIDYNKGTACAAIYFIYYNPIKAPTIEPTMEPTIEKTMASIEPTIEPTMEPTFDITSIITTPAGHTTQFSMVSSIMVLIIIALVSLMCCLLFVNHKKQNMKRKYSLNYLKAEDLKSPLLQQDDHAIKSNYSEYIEMVDTEKKNRDKKISVGAPRVYSQRIPIDRYEEGGDAEPDKIDIYGDGDIVDAINSLETGISLQGNVKMTKDGNSIDEYKDIDEKYFIDKDRDIMDGKNTLDVETQQTDENITDRGKGEIDDIVKNEVNELLDTMTTIQ